MDSHMVPEDNLPEHLNKLIGDHKKLFDQYASYTREHDMIYSKYVLMIEALKQEHGMLKMLMSCGEIDPLETKQKNTIKARLTRILDEESCVINEISMVIQQLKRDQLLIDKQSKVMADKKAELRVLMSETEEHNTRQKFLLELEYKKYMCAVHLNQSIEQNEQLRTKIDGIKRTRIRYEATFKKLIKEIQQIKEVKKVLLEEAQQFIEDKETTNSIINGMLSGNKKESALYQQKIESMKQMIRYDTKATDFLLRKLNERSDLKAVDQTKKTGELQEILEYEVQHLDKLKEEQDAIQDVTEETEGSMITKVYIQKEADKMALFNYIADLNGELIHLKQEHAALIDEIENLDAEDKAITSNFEASMAKNETVYQNLSEELEGCDGKSVEVNTTMGIIKEFIECTFRMLNCNMETMEANLGLDIVVNPRNMSAYLREIENEVCNMLNSIQYAEKATKLKEQSSVVISNYMLAQSEPLLGQNEDEEIVYSIKIAPNLIPHPVKDYPEYSAKVTSGGDVALSSKKSLEEGAREKIKDKMAASKKKSKYQFNSNTISTKFL